MSLKGTFIAWTLAAQNITVLQLGLKKIMPENYQFLHIVPDRTAWHNNPIVCGVY